MRASTFPSARRRSSSYRACSYCDALVAPAAKPESTPVAESDQFVAWVSVGPLTDGHLIVTPKRHVLNLQQLDAAEMGAFAPFLDEVRRGVEEAYGQVVLFEHGPVREGSSVGCSVDHAHLHIVPFRESLVARAREALPFDWRELVATDRALPRFDSDGLPYLFIEDIDGSRFLACHDQLPSQALRRVIAGSTGRTEGWDWKTNPRHQAVRRTLQRLL